MSWGFGFPYKSTGEIRVTTEFSDNLEIINTNDDSLDIIEVPD